MLGWGVALSKLFKLVTFWTGNNNCALNNCDLLVFKSQWWDSAHVLRWLRIHVSHDIHWHPCRELGNQNLRVFWNFLRIMKIIRLSPWSIVRFFLKNYEENILAGSQSGCFALQPAVCGTCFQTTFDITFDVEAFLETKLSSESSNAFVSWKQSLSPSMCIASIWSQKRCICNNRKVAGTATKKALPAHRPHRTWW